MAEKETLAEKICDEHVTVDNGTNLTGQVVEHPDVVVAYEYVYLHAAVRQLCHLSEEAGEAFRYDVTIFIPVVEHIAEEIDRLRLMLYAVHPAHQLSLNSKRVIMKSGAQMGVRHKEYLVSRRAHR